MASGLIRKKEKCLHLHMIEFSMYKILENFFKLLKLISEFNNMKDISDI